jgi:hypothetical protein
MRRKPIGTLMKPEWMALEQLERLRKDDEEATTIKKERDELLQRDTVAR